MSTGYLSPKTNKNTKTITWTSDFLTQGRQRACDIINIGDNRDTLLGKVRNIDTIVDDFSLLFDNQILDFFVRETNDFIETKLQTLKNFKEHLFKSSQYLDLDNISALAMRTLDHQKIDIINIFSYRIWIILYKILIITGICNEKAS